MTRHITQAFITFMVLTLGTFTVMNTWHVDSAEARGVSLAECAVQRTSANRTTCWRLNRTGELTRTPHAVARLITDNATRYCVWQLERAEIRSTTVFCRNGRTYVS